jgi:hypothetical protein
MPSLRSVFTFAFPLALCAAAAACSSCSKNDTTTTTTTTTTATASAPATTSAAPTTTPSASAATTSSTASTDPSAAAAGDASTAPSASTASTATTTSTPSAASSAKPPPKCGDKPLPPCPLYAWMKANTSAAMSAQDFPALVTALDRVVTFAPPGYGSWASIARDGAKAARAQDVDGVKASCRSCHDQYKAKYKKEMRDRPI